MLVLFHEQSGECFYCKTEMFVRGDVPKPYQRLHQGDMATFDHILVKSKGGGYSKSNGVCACFECNGIRGNMEQSKFIKNFIVLRKQWFERRQRKQERRDVNEANRYANETKKAILRKKRAKNKAINCYLVARFAIQSGKTVNDLFDKLVYNNINKEARAQ